MKNSPNKPTRLHSDEALQKLASDIKSGLVFTSWMIRNSDVITVFMPLLFLNKEQLSDLQKKKVVHFYEYLSKASPRAINGNPIFTSMYHLAQGDVDYIQYMVKALVESETRALAIASARAKKDLK
jgi:hypothetical protein